MRTGGAAKANALGFARASFRRPLTHGVRPCWSISLQHSLIVCPFCRALSLAWAGFSWLCCSFVAIAISTGSRPFASVSRLWDAIHTLGGRQ
jgi:hypothetical protein